MRNTTLWITILTGGAPPYIIGVYQVNVLRMKPELCQGELEGSLITMTEAEYQSWLDGQEEARRERDYQFKHDDL